jgi:DNA-binding MarR family transcriptional regulator
LVLEDAQKELKLSDEQIAKIAAIDEAFTTDRRKMFAEISKESGDRGRKLAEMNKQTAAKIHAILDEPQRKRLKEILLQVNGAVALEQDEMAATLGITEEQKSKLAEVRRANAKVRRETHAKLDGSSSQTLANKMAELHREAEKKLLEVLSDQQRKQFEQMQGEKIDLQLYKL